MNQLQLNNYFKEKWTYKDKQVQLIHLDEFKLNIVLKHLKYSKVKEFNSKDKSYWLKAVNAVLNHKLDNNLKLVDKLLSIKREERADRFVTNLCNNIKQMKFINRINKTIS